MLATCDLDPGIGVHCARRLKGGRDSDEARGWILALLDLASPHVVGASAGGIIFQKTARGDHWSQFTSTGGQQGML